MSRSRSLRGLLFASYGAVIVVVAAIGFVIVRFATPELFDRRLSGRGFGAGRGADVNPFEQDTAVSESLAQSVTIAAALAALVGAVVAALVAWLVLRRLVARFESVQDAAHRLAAGDLSARAPLPPEAELADLATSINRLGDSLATTARSRARLISDLAHELRNPLTTIKGSMEGLLDGVLSPTADTFASVAEEADRLHRLTGDLSLLARGQEGALDLDLVVIPLEELLGEVVSLLRTQADAQQVGLVAELATDCRVVADADRLMQVFVNIVANALTHTPADGRITVTCDRHGDMVQAVVRDTGSGIPADQLESVFERYTRLDHQGPGTGIGLNIARTIVHAHGGTIRAESAGLGEGTTLVVELPSA